MRALPSARVGWLALALASTLTSTLRAQGGGGPPVYAEYRADAIVGRGTSVQGGAGVSLPLGVYVRLAVDASAGATWRDATTRASGRVDAIGRFLLDPFREVPVALSLGGGVSVPYVDKQSQVRPYLLLVVDVEGRTRGPVTPALQIGLGGGTRVGLVLRTSTGRWR
jgi:hypothetical protein